MKNAIAIRHVCLRGCRHARARAEGSRHRRFAISKRASTISVPGEGHGPSRRARRPDRHLRDRPLSFHEAGARDHRGGSEEGRARDRHLPRLPGACRRACRARLSRQAEGTRLGRDDLDGGRQSLAARRHRGRARAELAWRHLRSSGRRDSPCLDRDHAEPGLYLRPQGARAAIPCRAAAARSWRNG